MSSDSATQKTAGNTEKEAGSALYRELPHDAVVERELLGALLINNDVLTQVGDFLKSEHFFEPVHQRIYAAVQKFYDRGQIANPVTLKQFFDQDEALADIGGAQYLVKLAAGASTIINVTDYGRAIYDMALKRALIHVGEEMTNDAYAPDIDVGAVEQIERTEQKLFNLSSEGSVSRGFEAVSIGATEAIKSAEAAFKSDGHVVGLSSGIMDLDKMLGGMQNSDLIILAGRPSMGKTSLATNIAHNAAKILHEKHQNGEEKASVGFFSLEMSAEQLAARMIATAAKLSSSSMRRGEVNDDEFMKLVQASNEVATLPFFIDDTPALSIAAVRTRARRLKRMHNMQLLIVDYLQLLRGSSVSSQASRVQEISEITQGLKAIAKELDIPVIALSQLSRAVEQREDKKPQLSDLRESGSIEQDADIVMFVFREEYYISRLMPAEDSPKFAEWQADMERCYGIGEVIIAKQRHGPIGTVKLAFIDKYTEFTDLAKDSYMPDRIG
ncbi:MAG: replicative DNA helicase [Rickettsiales bacterium]